MLKKLNSQNILELEKESAPKIGTEPAAAAGEGKIFSGFSHLDILGEELELADPLKLVACALSELDPDCFLDRGFPLAADDLLDKRVLRIPVCGIVNEIEQLQFREIISRNEVHVDSSVAGDVQLLEADYFVPQFERLRELENGVRDASELLDLELVEDHVELLQRELGLHLQDVEQHQL